MKPTITLPLYLTLTNNPIMIRFLWKARKDKGVCSRLKVLIEDLKKAREKSKEWMYPL